MVVVWYYFGMDGNEITGCNGGVFSIVSLIFGILTLPANIFGIILLAFYVGLNETINITIVLPFLLIAGVPAIAVILGCVGLRFVNASWQRNMAIISMSVSGFVFLLSCFILFVLFLI
jgi:hypothetical protein